MLNYQTANKSIAFMIRVTSICKNEDVRKHFRKQLKTSSGIYGNPTEIPTMRKNQLRVWRSLKLGKNG